MKSVFMFGPNSLERARNQARRHRRFQCADGTWIVLRGPDRRYAVCNFITATKLLRQGFQEVRR